MIRFLADDNAAVNALKSGDVDVLSPVNATLAKSLDASTYTVSAADGSDQVRPRLQLHERQTQGTSASARPSATSSTTRRLSPPEGNVDYALGGPIPSVDPGYEDLTGLYPYNVDKAKELMKEAGYTTDKPLRLTLTYANTYGTELGDQLKSQLAKIGIDLKIDYVEFSTCCRTCTPTATTSCHWWTTPKATTSTSGPRRTTTTTTTARTCRRSTQGARGHRRGGKQRIPQAGGEGRQRGRPCGLAVRLPCDRGVQHECQGIP